jgi:hypothetical protein
MNRRIFLSNAASVALVLSMMTGATAQTKVPVSSIPWNPSLGQVVLGRGMEIHPNQESVVGGAGVANTPYKWQQDSQSLKLLDYTSLTSTMQSLNVNAWGEANGFLASAQFSVNWSQYTAFQGNHRHWEVDALYYKTAFLPAPQLTAAAQSLESSPKDFEAKYGNYAVTGITYRRKITIAWDVTFNSSVSQNQFQAAISGSYDMFSGGSAVSSCFNSLQSFAQTTVTVTVEGQNGGPVLSAAIGQASDLNTVITAVQQLLNSWSVTPSDPTQAGTIDTVTLTPYTAIPGGPSVVADFSPNQTDLANAIVQYVYLDNSRTRLLQIQNTDTNLNPTLKAYIAAKMKEVTATRATAKTYVQNLTNNKPPVTPPDLSFQFDDPDVVQWHVVEYLTDGSSYYPIIEMYSNAQVHPFAPLPLSNSVAESDIWCANIKTVTAANGSSNEQFNSLVGPPIPEANSYTASLDPVTGIPHRYVALQWRLSGSNGTMTINLVTVSGDPFYNAIDWDGAMAQQIVISQTPWREVDNGQLLATLLGLR